MAINGYIFILVDANGERWRRVLMRQTKAFVALLKTYIHRVNGGGFCPVDYLGKYFFIVHRWFQ
jgi:hypothetical protein